MLPLPSPSKVTVVRWPRWSVTPSKVEWYVVARSGRRVRRPRGHLPQCECAEVLSERSHPNCQRSDDVSSTCDGVRRRARRLLGVSHCRHAIARATLTFDISDVVMSPFPHRGTGIIRRAYANRIAPRTARQIRACHKENATDHTPHQSTPLANSFPAGPPFEIADICGSASGPTYGWPLENNSLWNAS